MDGGNLETCAKWRYRKTKFVGKVRGGGTGRGSDRCGLGKYEVLETRHC